MTYDPRTYWDSRARRQGASYVGPMGEDDRAQFDQFAGTLRAFVQPYGKPHTLMDFGCGSGRFAKLLAGLATWYMGVDISTVGLSYTQLPLNGAFMHLRTDGIPLGDNSVDAVVAVTVFQHIVDEEEFQGWAGEIARVLRPGGAVVVIDEVRKLEQYPEHMNPRSPRIVGAALGLPPVDTKLVPGTGHWAARFL